MKFEKRLLHGILGSCIPSLFLIAEVGARDIENLDNIVVHGESNAHAHTGNESRKVKNTQDSIQSPGDLFKNIGGVEVGESRNSGAVDMNIRGLQGEGRVPVLIDGTQQQNTVYRGYSGVTSRSYIDPDLISRMTVSRGYANKIGLLGANGGGIEAKTLDGSDVRLPGQKIGLRIRSGLMSNAIKPPPDTLNADELKLEPGEFPQKSSSGLKSWKNYYYNIAFSADTDYGELLLAYAERKTGDYFTGKRGYNKYDKAYVGVKDVTSKDSYRNDFYYDIGHTYYAGDEILNTSNHSTSVLSKYNYSFGDQADIALIYRHSKNEHGEVMPSQLHRRVGNNDGVDVPLGFVVNPLSKTTNSAYAVDFRLQPEGLENIINLDTRLWYTKVKDRAYTCPGFAGTQCVWGHRYDYYFLRQDSRVWMDKDGNIYVTPEGQYDGNNEDDVEVGMPHQYTDPYLMMTPTDTVTKGFELSNQHSLKYNFVNINMDYGFAYKSERITPARYTDPRDYLSNRFFRDGTRKERNYFANFQFSTPIALQLDYGINYTKMRSQDNNQRVWAKNPDWPFPPDHSFTHELEPGFVHFYPDPKLKRKENAASQLLRLSWQAENGLGVYGKVSRAVRMPSLFESTIGFSMDPDQDLKPEKTLSFEYGLSFDKLGLFKTSDNLNMQLSYFDNKTKDYIDRTMDFAPKGKTDSWARMFRSINLESYRIKGLDLHINYATPQLSVGFSYNRVLSKQFCLKDEDVASIKPWAVIHGYVDASKCNSNGIKSAYVNNYALPKTIIKLGLAYKLLNERLVLGSNIRYYSASDRASHDSRYITDIGKGEISNIWYKALVADLQVKYHINKNLNMHFNIDNVTNVYYVDPLSTSLVPAPGRTFNLGMEYKF